jgi:hypothetical protein
VRLASHLASAQFSTESVGCLCEWRCAFFQITDYDHHEVIEIVRDATAQLADSLDLLGCGKLFLNGLQLNLCLLPLSDVAGHFRETRHSTVLRTRQLSGGRVTTWNIGVQRSGL